MLNKGETKIEHGIIVQSLIYLFPERRYLEIGVSKGIHFVAIEANYKVGVDPVQPSNIVSNALSDSCIYHSITSDAYFNTVIKEDEIFDVIYVDGLHEYKQAYRDIINALKFLAPNGIIVVHDCKPESKTIGLPPHLYEHVSIEERMKYQGHWTGDVWKAIVMLRSKFDDLNVLTLDCDFGCAIITKGEPESMLNYTLTEITQMSFDNLANNYTELLNLKSPDYFYEFIKNHLKTMEQQK